MNPLLPAIEVETAAMPSFSVIWMHGLGADGSDFEAVVPELGLDGCAGIRFIFPHAPEIPVTCNGGYVMPAWYDIVSLDSSRRAVDVAGLLRSRQAILRLIERENQRGVPCPRIFLTGHGYRVAWHEYPMPHSVCLEEVQEIGRWLRRRMEAS